MDILIALFQFVGAYFVGSVPTDFLIARLICTDFTRRCLDDFLCWTLGCGAFRTMRFGE